MGGDLINYSFSFGNRSATSLARSFLALAVSMEATARPAALSDVAAITLYTRFASGHEDSKRAITMTAAAPTTASSLYVS